ncbi:NADH-quinone oxidoreductase subunit N [Tautonia plasticadhaerens]|uniref:NADH-quinone oxidoreductase subunit N n=1 Tax=Tautonia plasticadhaerens TaxID=2527974 RepID=A0A518H8I1_9BACT|nr:NADH-quinone oxidoreductase subunit N [Tautonia plasticadhaerens]QDV37145.1 NADH-quinone oxidoreductase subunit N [Tautonia plasticadhaerens]
MTPDQLETLSRTLLILLPEIVISLSATAIMVAGPFFRQGRSLWAGVSGLALLASLVTLFAISGADTETFAYGSVALNDSLSFYARFAFLVTGLILLGLGHNQVADDRAPEFFGALLFVIAGSMIVSTANELIFLFVGLELVSIPTYLLLYLPRRDRQTQEAVTKYFFLSVFSSALLLFGFAYLYGLTGVSNLKALAFLMNRGGGVIDSGNVAFGLIAVVFITAGLGFRVAAVPFHFYAPDVYQGAPTVVTALLAWIPKGIGFVAMIRALTTVISVGDPILVERAILLAWVIAAVTLVLGNTVALVQTNLKRLFAYSSIAHAGYLMIGVATAFARVEDPSAIGPYSGTEGILFYLAAYALMTLGAFGVILYLDSVGERAETIDDLSGLSRTRPLLSLAMALCLFSLAGVPPLAGFWGKFTIFTAAWSAEPVAGIPSLRALAVIGVINAAIGAFYYLRIVAAIYYGTPAESTSTGRDRAPWPTALAVGVCAVLSLVFGLIPGPIQSASRSSAVASIRLPQPAVDAEEESVALVDPAD